MRNPRQSQGLDVVCHAALTPATPRLSGPASLRLRPDYLPRRRIIRIGSEFFNRPKAVASGLRLKPLFRSSLKFILPPLLGFSDALLVLRAGILRFMCQSGFESTDQRRC
jgi:hypothetical protein